jgi:lysyl-tRNA synthetase class 2
MEKGQPRVGQEAGGEEALIQARKAKAARVRERGDTPFPNGLTESERVLLGDLRNEYSAALIDPVEMRYDPEQVTNIGDGRQYRVWGRLMELRGFGKASFLRLREAS